VDARVVAVIVDELLSIVQSGSQDLDWQPWYEDERQLVEDLRDHADRARRGDDSRLPELKFMLAPTGALNEIAISSGWAASYLRLANEFDRLYPGPFRPPPPPPPPPPQPQPPEP
jgi:hypothetical protein